MSEVLTRPSTAMTRPGSATDQQIRDIPVVNSKYKDVWQRWYHKLIGAKKFKRLNSHIQKFGTDLTSVIGAEGDIEKIIQQKHQSLNILKAESDNEVVVYQPIPFCMFHPDKTPKGVANGILAFLLIYTATVMPYKIAFIDSVPGDGWFYLDIVIDTLFFLDVCVNLTSAYYDEERVLITNRKMIFCNYLKSWMIPDLIACFPFNLIQQDDNQQSGGGGGMNSLIRLVRLPRLYRLARISKFLKAMQKSQGGFMEKLQEFLSVKQSVIRLTTTFVTVLMLLHIISWFWYFVAKLDGFGPDTWVVRMGYENDDPGKLYLASFYWALVTLTTVGYGDITALTSLERVLAMGWMTFGMIFFSFTIGNLTAMVGGMDSKETILSNKLQLIDQFCIEARLSKVLKRRLKKTLKYSTEQTGVTAMQDLFNDLPKALKFEVCLAMHNGAMKKIPFFNEKDAVFVTTVVPFLTPLMIPADDFVYEENDYADEVYFIVKGRVNYVLKIRQKKIPYKSLNEGSYFGEFETIEQLPRKSSVQAQDACDLFILNYPLIMTIKKTFPVIFDQIVDTSFKRDEADQKAKQDMLQFFKDRKAKRKRATVPANMEEEHKKQEEAKQRRDDEKKKSLAVSEASQETKPKKIIDNLVILKKLEKQEEEMEDLEDKLDEMLALTNELIEIQNIQRPLKQLATLPEITTQNSMDNQEEERKISKRATLTPITKQMSTDNV